MSNKNKMRVGITGQAGFIGTHLFNFLGLDEQIERIPFKDDFFTNDRKLDEFISQCDVIVHLAAVNRHHDSKVLYDINVGLTRQLIKSLEAGGYKPHIIYSSSIQEERDNIYGNSKRKCREMLIEWSIRNEAPFTGLVIPNVFGPFGKPFYNSVISTFSYQLVNGQRPEIYIDAELPLVYVNDLIHFIHSVIIERKTADRLEIGSNVKIRVSEILKKLQTFQAIYIKEGIFPDLSDRFDLALFNTFRSYLPVEFFPRNYICHADERGSFVELVKSMNGGQTSYSTTKKGITRGNHFHLRKVERFMVLRGEAVMRLRRIGSNDVIEYKLSGDNPAFVDVPVWHTHNITNIGEQELLTAFWINEMFNPDDPDTFFETV